MHRLHSDRHAWPLSSPWWGLPVAPGGVLLEPTSLHCPFRLLCQAGRVSWSVGKLPQAPSAPAAQVHPGFPGSSRVRSQRPQARPLTEVAMRLSPHTWLCLRPSAISVAHPSWALKRGHSLGPWWPCLFLHCFLIPITSQLDFVESALGFPWTESPRLLGSCIPGGPGLRQVGRAGGSSLSPQQEAAPAMWWGLLAAWGWPAARVV